MTRSKVPFPVWQTKQQKLMDCHKNGEEENAWNEITPHSEMPLLLCAKKEKRDIKHQREAKQMTQWFFSAHLYIFFYNINFIYDTQSTISFPAYGSDVDTAKRNCGWCAAAEISSLPLFDDQRVIKILGINFDWVYMQ